MMGSGLWSVDRYATAAGIKARAGTPDFAYSRSTMHAPPSARKVHPNLDPMGVKFRESRDSDEHPESVAIAVFFDVTGSMHSIPEVLQKKLPELMGTLIRKGYVEHPQILFGAIGDAGCDQMPLQVGQFESDNRMDENLEMIVLEGGGGGGNHESYELAAYFMARHTSIDCFEKRGHKGYLFIVGDERIYSSVRAEQVKRLIGDGLETNLPTAQIFAELRERYEVFFLFAKEGSYQPEQVTDTDAGDAASLGWKRLLGQNVLELDRADAVCESVALAIGISEGVVDVAAGIEDLVDMGSSVAAAKSAGSALVAYAAGRAGGRSGAIATVDGGSAVLAAAGGGSSRL
jgi:hypothetical protein